MSASVSVQRNHAYKAVFKVPWPFGASTLLSHLVDAGFDKVNVKSLGGGRFEATGVWPHADATADVDHLDGPVTDLGAVP